MFDILVQSGNHQNMCSEWPSATTTPNLSWISVKLTELYPLWYIYCSNHLECSSRVHPMTALMTDPLNPFSGWWHILLTGKKSYGPLHDRPSCLSWWQKERRKKKRVWKWNLDKEKTLWSSVTGQRWECQPPRVLFSGREVESPIPMCSYIFSFTGDQLSPLALTPTIYTHFTSLHRPHHRAPCWAVPATGINRVSRHVWANAAHSHWGNPSEASRRLREMSEHCGSDQSILAYRDADRSYLSLI